MAIFRQSWQFRRPKLVIVWLILVISSPVMGEVDNPEMTPVPVEMFATNDMQAQTADVLQELVQILDQESELATKTKMNIDFVPGIMSVLHGKDLIARGVQNVYEALGLVPGIELSRTNDGQPQILVRGIGKSFFSSKIKFLLNNTPFNATLGAATTILILPIEQVERIEVIRGPGSAIYGEYASVGVVNVITRKGQSALFARVSDLDKESIGGMFSYEAPENNLAINLSFSQVNADGGDVEAGNDILFGTPLQPISNSPGPVNNAEEHHSFLLDVNFNDYAIVFQRVHQGLGDFFGLANALPDDHQHVVRKITMQSLEVSREWQLDSDWSARGTIGLLQFDLESGAHELFPPGFTSPPPTSYVYPQGVLGGPSYNDNKYYLGVDLNFNGLQNHEILLGADVSQIEPDEIYVLRNYDPNTMQPETTPAVVARYDGAGNWLEEGHNRLAIGIYAQDQFQLSKKLKLTMGLRFDHYDDVGSDVTPRLAGVYNLTDRQTLKFQYARSFRPPTFLELYTQNNLVVTGNEDLESESVDTLEAGYVYNNGTSVFRSTFFYFVARDLITIDGPSRRYVNEGEITSTGFELELQHQVSRSIKIDATVTRLFTENDQTDDDVAGVAELVSNFAFLLQPWPDYAFAIQFKAIGDRSREQSDARPDLDGYTVIDVTANMFNLGIRNLNLRGGIKNIFDNDVVYPAPLASLPTPTGPVVRPGYLNDYPQTGREIFLQLDYQFD